MTAKKRVLVIDDSAFMRQFLKDVLNNSGDLTVTAAVRDPVKALDLLRKQDFDVITMDIETPQMDGFAFLQYLMNFNPKPVVVISSATQANSNATETALSLGVVAVVAKPEVGYKEGVELLTAEIVAKVQMAVNTGVKTLIRPPKSAPEIVKSNGKETTEKVIVIGASTGGTIALDHIFKDLHPELPGIIVIQHMPENFTGDFAMALSQISFLQVKEAKDGQNIIKGTAVVVPGGKNVALQKEGTKYAVKVLPRFKDSVYSPSIDYTFQSVAEQAGKNAMGVILTGMGDDGAKGLRVMFDNGAYTIAQDQKTSAIFGMPQKAIAYGGVCKVVSLAEVAQEINKWGLTNRK